jgi:hypothetical protein
VRHNVAVVEWFPYHSAKKPSMREPLPSQEYGFALVDDAIERGAVIVQIRSKREWFDAVDTLTDIQGTDRYIECNAPLSGYVSRGNMPPAAFDNVCAAVADG